MLSLSVSCFGDTTQGSPCCLLLRVASPNDLNLGTLVTSEPRLNPGFTSWGDFVGSTVERVQWSTVIHSDPGCDPLGSDPANGYTTYITQVLSDTLLFLLAPKNTTFFFLQVLFRCNPLSMYVEWPRLFSNAGHHCSTTSSSVRGPQNPQPPTPSRAPCRAGAVAAEKRFFWGHPIVATSRLKPVRWAANWVRTLRSVVFFCWSYL